MPAVCDWEKIYTYSTAGVHCSLHSRNARVVHSVCAHFTRILRACNTKLHAVDMELCVILPEILQLYVIERVQWGQNVNRIVYIRGEERPPHPGSLTQRVRVQNIFLWCFMIIFARITWPNKENSLYSKFFHSRPLEIFVPFHPFTASLILYPFKWNSICWHIPLPSTWPKSTVKKSFFLVAP